MLHTRGRKGKTTKRIRVFSNDPSNPKIELTLKGEIVVDVNVTPSYISFGEVPVGETPTKTFDVEVLNPDKVKIKSVTVEDDRFTLKEIKKGEKGKSTWEIALKEAKEIGRISSNIVVEYEESKTAKTTVSIRARIVGNLKYPNHVYLLKGENGYKSRDIKIHSRKEGTKFKVISAKDPDGKVDLKIDKKSDTETVVSVSLKNPTQKLENTLKGAIHIKTTDPTEPEFEVRYSATARHSSSRMKRKILEKRGNKKPSHLDKMKKNKQPEGAKAQVQ